MKYELVAGLETHIELLTKSKMFCSCTTEFGGEPNTHCCEVCLGHPGAMPVINREAVRLAVMAGLALGCRINTLSYMDRKNYFYPDLPKAYQISQFDVPLCEGGFLMLRSGKKIRINRIHIEEDAGKLIHRDDAILADYNRCGVPLIEIVTEPDFSSAEEVAEYTEVLRHLMRFVGVSDCRMQEGSMRCDVNISVRLRGDKALGTRTEIKNMNSVSNIVRAMEYEYSRQCSLLSAGGAVVQETLRFDEVNGTTHSMRSKENAQDYRFFPEPDLLSVYISEEETEIIRQSMPELPHSRMNRYVSCYGISQTDAGHLTKYRRISEYFEAVAAQVQNPQIAANFIIGQFFSLFATEKEKERFDVSVSTSQLAELVTLIEQGKIRTNLAKATLDKMLATGKSAGDLLTEDDLRSFSAAELSALCERAVSENTAAVYDYKSGKEKALMALLGAVMRLSRGKADPEGAKALLTELLSK